MNYQARTGPAGYREIPGGPVGRWAGGPVTGGPVERLPEASKNIMIIYTIFSGY